MNTVLAVLPSLLGQSEAPDPQGSNPAVLIVGVLLVTFVGVLVVIRRRRSES